MWKILSIDDTNSITFNNKNDDKIILLNDIFKFFIYKIKNVDVENNCLCGQEIFHNNFIYHINTLNEYVVGSECISCWNNPIYDKQVKVSSELSYCHFCFRNKKCSNCSKKQYIKTIFTLWKTFLYSKINYLNYNYNTTITFGKYKNSTLYSLCNDENYSSYILNNNFNSTLKTNILSYRKNKILIDKMFLYKNDIPVKKKKIIRN